MAKNIGFRTGDGDGGDTLIGGKTFRKGHPVVQYLASLELLLSASCGLPLDFGELKVRTLFQELIFRLYTATIARYPKQQEAAIVEISTLLESQIQHLTTYIGVESKLLRSTNANGEIHMLRSHARMAETLCIAARDKLELESLATSANLIYILEKSGVALNIICDWLFAFICAYSATTSGQVLSSVIWKPMDDETIKAMNQ
jgi:cob(I)alamin adenosyltransferase